MSEVHCPIDLKSGDGNKLLPSSWLVENLPQRHCIWQEDWPHCLGSQFPGQQLDPRSMCCDFFFSYYCPWGIENFGGENTYLGKKLGYLPKAWWKNVTQTTVNATSVQSSTPAAWLSYLVKSWGGIWSYHLFNLWVTFFLFLWVTLTTVAPCISWLATYCQSTQAPPWAYRFSFISLQQKLAFPFQFSDVAKRLSLEEIWTQM